MVTVSNVALVSKRISRSPNPESNVHNVLLDLHQSCFSGAETYLWSHKGGYNRARGHKGTQGEYWGNTRGIKGDTEGA